ncbi:MAG: TolC family protein [Clostridium sp.]|nr:TolC family protein [Clostridium sp.]
MRQTLHSRAAALLTAALVSLTATAQPTETPRHTVSLTLEKAIDVAIDSSLNSLLAQNKYLAGYWQYRSYQAERLPSLNFTTTPIQYYQNFVKRYDSQQNIDVYKQQKNIYSSAGLQARQNVVWTGGVLSLETDLDYLRSFGLDKSTQFSSVPVRLRYSQALFGYNAFKWSKRIEPVEYERAQKELVYAFEEISGVAIRYFFNQALNQMLYDMSRDNVARCDTAYQIGLERHRIGNITQADLLTLKLNAINARNSMENTRMNLDKSTFALASFLRYAPDTQFDITLPTRLPAIIVPTDKALAYAHEGNPKMQELALSLLKAQQNLDRVEKSRFTSSVSLSVGFNQAAERFKDVYHEPLRQDAVSISFSVPLMDWGVEKGKVNMAKSNLNTAVISKKQAEEAFDQEVVLAVRDFNMRNAQIASAAEACKVAELAYEATYQRYLIGKADVNTLSMALSRRNEAQSGYINTLSAYWTGFYEIRKYTLFDFVHNRPLQVETERILKSNSRKR